jgi:hypothetical protein
MELIQDLKDKISIKTIENFAGFLGESTNDVESGLLLSLKAFLAGLMKFANTEPQQQNIINVLNDGGHTGDIFRNIENFSDNNEKTQLLVTIGNNIVNHFLTSNTISLVEKIAKISEIRKTSASSLLSLAAPLVLGYVGKHVRENSLDHKGLGLWFNQYSDSIFQSLPPAIGNILSFKKSEPELELKIKEENNTLQESKPLIKKSSINWGALIPWLFLGVAGAYALIYWYSNNKLKNNLHITIPVLKEKKQDLSPEDFLPDSTVSELPPEVNIVSPKIESKVLDVIPKETPKQTETSTIKTQDQKDKTPSPVLNDSEKNLKIQNKEVVGKEPAKSNVPAGYRSIDNSSFVKNSAEISINSLINILVKELNSDSGKKLTILHLKGLKGTLAEDRAYSLEGLLIENGVDPSQITVSKSANGSNPSGVAYKILK